MLLKVCKICKKEYRTYNKKSIYCCRECLKKGVKGENNPRYKTGLTMNKNSLYTSWQEMKKRCLNKNNEKYHRYGGRGICVCPEWMSIINFSQWAYNNGWKEGYTIDRIDNNGNYCPENCRWVSRSENSRKKSTTKIDMETAKEIRSRINEDWHKLAKEYGVNHGTIWFIMKNFTHVPDGECSKKIKERVENEN